MSSLFYRKPRLTVLAIGLIVVSGVGSYYALPRMEDPLLADRVAAVHARFPGADARRVEALVTEPLERRILEVEGIKELRSSSQSGIATIAIELRDDVGRNDVAEIWSEVRDKIDGARAELPAEIPRPEFQRIHVKAYAWILGLKWTSASPPNRAILTRLSEQLADAIRAIPGTQEIDHFGHSEEEITVEIAPAQLAAIGLSAQGVAERIRASDAKTSAGRLRGSDAELLLTLAGELDTLERIRSVPIRYGAGGHEAQLSDIADVRKGALDPPPHLVLLDGRPAVAVAVMVLPSSRLDRWMETAAPRVAAFTERLPKGVELVTVFQQSRYVEASHRSLMTNLMLGGLAVIGVVLVMMGWRSALIVSLSLLLSAMLVLAGMRLLHSPIHQISVTGLILALGLLIDTAIVMVDEVTARRRSGEKAADALSGGVRYLAMPLFAATLTTALAFGPIALMPGPIGEFVGSLGTTVILAISSSLLISLTILPPLAAWRSGDANTTAGPTSAQTRSGERRWWRDGLTNRQAAEAYRRGLGYLFTRPLLGLAAGLMLPLAGFLVARDLPEQFFPPANRDQFVIELEMPAQTPISHTLQTVRRLERSLLAHRRVKRAHWFLGQSAPAVYYNMIPRNKHSPHYAQGYVQLDSLAEPGLLRRLQAELDRKFAGCRVLVRQIEQGRSFEAPIRLRVFGSDLDVLRRLSDDIRGHLAQVPSVIHTRSRSSEARPTLSLAVDEAEARLAGLDHAGIARQLDAVLEGAVGGSMLEATEQLPVRVRMANASRGDLDAIRSVDLVSDRVDERAAGGVPLMALGEIQLRPAIAVISRFGGQRVAEIEAYTAAGVLPAVALAEFRDRVAEAGLELPPAYRLEYAGETAHRAEAVDNLLANVSVLAVLLVAVLVILFWSFRLAGLVILVAILSVGLGLGSLWWFGYPFGFMAILGAMGLAGIAMNDAIVVLAALESDEAARHGDVTAVSRVVVRATRHVLATSLTTMAGFLPLCLDGGDFWPPLAVAIAGGVAGATVLALALVPSAYLLLRRAQP